MYKKSLSCSLKDADIALFPFFSDPISDYLMIKPLFFQGWAFLGALELPPIVANRIKCKQEKGFTTFSQKDLQFAYLLNESNSSMEEAIFLWEKIVSSVRKEKDLVCWIFASKEICELYLQFINGQDGFYYHEPFLEKNDNPHYFSIYTNGIDDYKTELLKVSNILGSN